MGGKITQCLAHAIGQRHPYSEIMDWILVACLRPMGMDEGALIGTASLGSLCVLSLEQSHCQVWEEGKCPRFINLFVTWETSHTCFLVLQKYHLSNRPVKNHNCAGSSQQRHRKSPRQPPMCPSPFHQEWIPISSLCSAPSAGLLTAALSPSSTDVVTESFPWSKVMKWLWKNQGLQKVTGICKLQFIPWTRNVKTGAFEWEQMSSPGTCGALPVWVRINYPLLTESISFSPTVFWQLLLIP